jgi:ADP-heptose:LPS heptosyltransferase
VLAAVNEREKAEPLLAVIPNDRCIDLVGKIDLLTAAAVLRRCAMFIGNDTGLMHIAAAADTPTLGLFGPSPVVQYAPWGRRAAYVRSTDSPDVMFGPGFDHRTTDTLMDGLSVDAAEAAAAELWRSVGSAAA